eukprot:g13509.t1
MPHSWNLNAKRTFSEAFDANVAETEAAFRQRRTVMNNAWDDLDEHSKALGQRMLEVGITKPAGSEEGMLRLNVGGAPVNIRRSALEGRGYLGHLFGSLWDMRLPRDADGLVVLDQSPTCVKYIIQTIINSSDDADAATGKLASGDGLLADENGCSVAEVETFRACPAKMTSPVPSSNLSLTDIPAFDATKVSTEGGRDDDIRSFGVFVADSLMEEKTALGQAHDELAKASKKAAMSASALATVYGPEVAAGKQDAGVELSVRGTRMTTLRSTLQACPDSALATQFDEDKWPATEKDLDERGRRVMNCSPSVFSKVLDVLRMRERSAWDSSVAYAERRVRVVVKVADRAAFEEFVGMYFPGCDDFIMEHVAGAPRESTAGD